MAVRSLQDQYFSYPLNLDEYIGAECVQVWHYGRTTGVFSANTNLQVTAINALGVGLKFGVAYLKINELGGAVFANTSDTTLVIDTSSPTAPRVDRVVIRYTEATQKIEPAILKGTPNSIPQAPDITRNGDVYEISLAQVRVNAGATIITAGNITDERLNEAVCGLVRDGVTGIPTQGLYDEFMAWFDTIRNTLDTEVATNLYNLIEQLRTDLTNHINGAPAAHITSGSFGTNRVDHLNRVTGGLEVQSSATSTTTLCKMFLGDNGSGEIVRVSGGVDLLKPLYWSNTGQVFAGADATQDTGVVRYGQVFDSAGNVQIARLTNMTIPSVNQFRITNTLDPSAATRTQWLVIAGLAGYYNIVNGATVGSVTFDSTGKITGSADATADADIPRFGQLRLATIRTADITLTSAIAQSIPNYATLSRISIAIVARSRTTQERYLIENTFSVASLLASACVAHYNHQSINQEYFKAFCRLTPTTGGAANLTFSGIERGTEFDTVILTRVTGHRQ